jgi:1-acyl-sn-glycerol-3-phosphate acyltransferase
VLLVANHPADVDPPFLGTACLPRDLLFVTNSRHFEKRAFSALLFSVGAFPLRVDRMDTRAIRYARSRLEEGMVVGIFPEGQASFSDELLPFQDGMGYLALTEGTTVVPVAIWGTRELFTGRRPSGRGPVVVRFGEAFAAPRDGSRKERAREVTTRAGDAVGALVRDLVEAWPP